MGKKQRRKFDNTLRASESRKTKDATINKRRKIKIKVAKEELRSVINTQKLKSNDCKRRYQEKIREEIEEQKHELESENIEQLWQLFKKICLKAAEEVCRIKVLSNTRKQTPWWSEEIRCLRKVQITEKSGERVYKAAKNYVLERIRQENGSRLQGKPEVILQTIDEYEKNAETIGHRY
ncbi:hypothetical protein ILUMI_02894 [Ignelater luminosus]|uniref:Uncharacterized protein n=1 Tax=Ignelater luminosus TaxID=2038154 RepID=A0A8K0GMQ9_IGNLU|nr:hypothetical protein ILUMI_02894 [Ignelater luminosus]